MPDNTPHMFTTAEVAAHLRVDPSTVRRWISAGVLPAVKVGRDYRVSGPALTRALGAARTSSPLTTTHGQVTR